MTDSNDFKLIQLSKLELQILIYSLGNSQPVSKELEVEQFKLYHKLLFRFNEMK